MSIRVDTSTDTLRATVGSVFSGTGPITFGVWVKPMVDPNASRMFYRFWNASTGNGLGLGTNGGGDFIHGLALGGTGIGDYNFTNGVWYYCVTSRDNGANATFRIFSDSTSTTPLNGATGESIADTTNYSGVDDIYFGDDGDGTAGYDAELESWKVHYGVEWSNAQCRTESQFYTPQTAGGSTKYAIRLSDIDADTDGIVEYASAFTLTNSGVVNGASRPDQLEALGGGGGSSPRSPGKVYPSGRTPMAIRPSTSNRIIIS